MVVVGAGKAGAGMAEGFLAALGDDIARTKGVTGWVNVPDDCAGSLPGIELFAARPPGENVPTERVIYGTRKIMDLVRSCEPNDLCVCLISGGGSALLESPAPPVTLRELIALTEHLSAQRANIRQLNAVRKQISQVKGGRLAAACRAPLVTLIISDVLGDPLDVIASGPTVAAADTAEDALEILREFDPGEGHVAGSIYAALRTSPAPPIVPSQLAHVHNVVVGNLRIAIKTAHDRARALGYESDFRVPTSLEGLADRIGCGLVDSLRQLDLLPGPQAWIEGGEPVVQLVDADRRGKGGRNQQVILAAAAALSASASPLQKNFCLLSGGTDGEDGPTDAAGAWLDNDSLDAARRLGLNPCHYLERNDGYHFFDPLGTLLRTGPTRTNVCDLRIVLSE